MKPGTPEDDGSVKVLSREEVQRRSQELLSRRRDEKQAKPDEGSNGGGGTGFDIHAAVTDAPSDGKSGSRGAMIISEADVFEGSATSLGSDPPDIGDFSSPGAAPKGVNTGSFVDEIAPARTADAESAAPRTFEMYKPPGQNGGPWFRKDFGGRGKWAAIVAAGIVLFLFAFASVRAIGEMRRNKFLQEQVDALREKLGRSEEAATIQSVRELRASKVERSADGKHAFTWADGECDGAFVTFVECAKLSGMYANLMKMTEAISTVSVSAWVKNSQGEFVQRGIECEMIESRVGQCKSRLQIIPGDE